MITHRKENIKQHRYHFQNSKVQIIKGPDGEGEKKNRLQEIINEIIKVFSRIEGHELPNRECPPSAQ